MCVVRLSGVDRRRGLRLEVGEVGLRRQGTGGHSRLTVSAPAAAAGGSVHQGVNERVAAGGKNQQQQQQR